MSKNITDARFAGFLADGTRSEGTVKEVAQWFATATGNLTVRQAQWIHVRVADGVKGKDLAAEASVTAGRVSQMRTAIAGLVDSGIPVADVTHDILRVSEVLYKNGGKDMHAAQVEAISALADVAAKVEAWQAVILPEPKKRAARTDDGSKGDKDNGEGGDAPSGDQSTTVPATVADLLRIALARIESGDVPEDERATVVRLADSLAVAAGDLVTVAAE